MAQAQEKLVCKLPAGIGLVIDGKPVMMSSKGTVCVRLPWLYTAERLIYLHDGKESHTIYVPSHWRADCAAWHEWPGGTPQGGAMKRYFMAKF